jgi:hypothetical protein
MKARPITENAPSAADVNKFLLLLMAFAPVLGKVLLSNIKTRLYKWIDDKYSDAQASQLKSKIKESTSLPETFNNKQHDMKLKSLLEVASSDLSKLLKDVQKCTDRNAHTEAQIEIAKFLKEKKLEKILNGILELHLEIGSMPPELAKLRSNIAAELMKIVERKHGKDVATQINDAL